MVSVIACSYVHTIDIFVSIDLVLSSISNLKSVRFFNLVLWYDYSIVVTGDLTFTMQHKCMCMSSHSYA